MDTTKNLQFIDTYTVEQFKAAQHVEKIQVRENPHTGKLFFTYGSKTGAVKGEPTEQNPSGQFYLLHEEGNGGAPVVAEF